MEKSSQWKTPARLCEEVEIGQLLGHDDEPSGSRPLPWETTISGSPLDGQNWQYATVGEAKAAGYRLTLLAHGPLHTGYNHLMLQITNPEDQTVTQAKVSFNPTMHMPEMTHAAPVEQPDAQAHSDGFFGGAIGFPMPSGPDFSFET